MLAADAALPSLKAAVSAGEHLPAATWRAFLDATGVRIIDGIGATEMLHIFVSAAGDDIVPGSTGCRYLDDPRQRDYVVDGWNITGDTFTRDADGYFFYQARSDDMIVSSGYNIAAPEVEEALLKHPEVAECAVVGVPDEARGSLVKAYVVLVDAGSATAEKVRELQDFTKAEIAPYKYPRAVEFVDALPRTATGKLQRFRLRQDA